MQGARLSYLAMNIISREQLTKRFQSLPDTLQDAVFSERTADTIGKTCQLRDVGEDFISTVATLTGRILLGYLRPENFASEIQKETGVEELKAQHVAHDIDTEIFSGVRLELKKLYPPTIQTPTVQSPGFARQELGIKNNESGMGAQNSRFKIQEQKPRYVVPIPEKFLKHETHDTKLETKDVKPEIQDSSPKIQEPPKPAPPQKMNQESGIRNQESKMKGEVEKQDVPSQAMKPVVPLPTFIHTKFQDKDKHK